MTPINAVLTALRATGALKVKDVCIVTTSPLAPFIIKSVDEGWCRTWQCNPDQVIGKPLSVIAGPGSGNEHVGRLLANGARVKSFVDCGVIFNYPVTDKRRPISHRLLIGPITNEKGETTALMGVSVITTDMEVANELAASHAMNDTPKDHKCGVC